MRIFTYTDHVRKLVECEGEAVVAVVVRRDAAPVLEPQLPADVLLAAVNVDLLVPRLPRVPLFAQRPRSRRGREAEYRHGDQDRR